MMKEKTYLLVSLFLLAVSGCGTTSSGKRPETQDRNTSGNQQLQVKVTNVNNREGTIRLNLFRKGEGFPGQKEKAFRSRSVSINNEPVQVTFRNLPPGNYAVAVYHDQNDDGTLNKGGFGVPEEGYGTSGSADTGIGSPSFSRSSFELSGGKKAISISLKYLRD